MNAALTIREASRFMIGATLLRDTAQLRNPGHSIGFDDVVQGVLSTAHPDAAEKLRSSIEHLADIAGTEGFLRNTPSHAKITPRVLQTRAADLAVAKSVQNTILVAFEHADPAFNGRDATSRDVLEGATLSAYRAIDQTPGSNHEKTLMLDQFTSDMLLVANNHPEMVTFLEETQTKYLDLIRRELLEPFMGSDAKKQADTDYTM